MYIKGPPGSKSKKKEESSDESTNTDNADELISIIENTPV